MLRFPLAGISLLLAASVLTACPAPYPVALQPQASPVPSASPEATYRLTGRVLFRGEGVADYAVRAIALSPGGTDVPLPATARTDAEGRFSLEVPARERALVIRAEKSKAALEAVLARQAAPAAYALAGEAEDVLLTEATTAIAALEASLVRVAIEAVPAERREAAIAEALASLEPLRQEVAARVAAQPNLANALVSELAGEDAPAVRLSLVLGLERLRAAALAGLKALDAASAAGLGALSTLPLSGTGLLTRWDPEQGELTLINAETGLSSSLEQAEAKGVLRPRASNNRHPVDEQGPPPLSGQIR